MPKPKNESCNNCYYCVDCECRRDTPMIQSKEDGIRYSTVGYWPSVDPDTGWCGSWQGVDEEGNPAY